MVNAQFPTTLYQSNSFAADYIQLNVLYVPSCGSTILSHIYRTLCMYILSFVRICYHVIIYMNVYTAVAIAAVVVATIATAAAATATVVVVVIARARALLYIKEAIVKFDWYSLVQLDNEEMRNTH